MHSDRVCIVTSLTSSRSHSSTPVLPTFHAGLACGCARSFFPLVFLPPPSFFFLSRRGLIFFPLALVFRPTSFRVCPSSRPSAGGRGLSYTSNAAPSIPLLSHAAHFWSTPSSSEGSSGHHSRLPSPGVLVSAHHLALSSGSVVLCVRGRLDGMAEVSRQDVPLHGIAYFVFCFFISRLSHLSLQSFLPVSFLFPHFYVCFASPSFSLTVYPTPSFYSFHHHEWALLSTYALHMSWLIT